MKIASTAAAAALLMTLTACSGGDVSNDVVDQGNPAGACLAGAEDCNDTGGDMGELPMAPEGGSSSTCMVGDENCADNGGDMETGPPSDSSGICAEEQGCDPIPDEQTPADEPTDLPEDPEGA